MYMYVYVSIICICIHIPMHIHIHICRHIYIYIYTHTHTHTHTCVYIYIYMYMYIYIYVCVYIYIHRCINTARFFFTSSLSLSLAMYLSPLSWNSAAVTVIGHLQSIRQRIRQHTSAAPAYVSIREHT